MSTVPANRRLAPGQRVRSTLNPSRLGTYLGLVGTWAAVQWDDRLDSAPTPYRNVAGGGQITDGLIAPHLYLRTWSISTRGRLVDARLECTCEVPDYVGEFEPPCPLHTWIEQRDEQRQLRLEAAQRRALA